MDFLECVLNKEEASDYVWVVYDGVSDEVLIGYWVFAFCHAFDIGDGEVKFCLVNVSVHVFYRLLCDSRFCIRILRGDSIVDFGGIFNHYFENLFGVVVVVYP